MHVPNTTEWRPFGHVSIDHKLLTACEQWENSRHRLLWLAVVNCNIYTCIYLEIINIDCVPKLTASAENL